MSHGIKVNGATLAISVLLTCGTGCGDASGGEAEASVELSQPITGGTIVVEGDPPYFDSVVGIGDCTGTKIGVRRFLTSASCADDFPQVIELGNENFQPDITETVHITAIHLHPSWLSWDSARGAYDAALVDIAENTPHIPILNFALDDVAGGRWFRAVGYGCDSSNPDHGAYKQWAQFQAHSRSAFGTDAIIDNTYAHNAGSRTPGVEICLGDSGGPLLDSAGRIAGLAAIRPAAAPDLTGNWFARTASIINWIRHPEHTNRLVHGARGFLMSRVTAYCLGIRGSSLAAGAAAESQYCNGANQPDNARYFRLISLGNSGFQIQSMLSGRCLDVTNDTSNVAQYNCAASPRQRWTFWDAGNGGFTIRNGELGRCLRPGGFPSGERQTLDLCNDTDNWVFHP